MLKGKSCCFSVLCHNSFCSVLFLWPPHCGLPAEENWMIHDVCCAFDRWALLSYLWAFLCMFLTCLCLQSKILRILRVSIVCDVSNHFKAILKIFTIWSTLSCFLNEVSHSWGCTQTLSFNRHYILVTLASQLCMP